jgi:hypothetical protein
LSWLEFLEQHRITEFIVCDAHLGYSSQKLIITVTISMIKLVKTSIVSRLMSVAGHCPMPHMVLSVLQITSSVTGFLCHRALTSSYNLRCRGLVVNKRLDPNIINYDIESSCQGQTRLFTSGHQLSDLEHPSGQQIHLNGHIANLETSSGAMG